MFVKITHSLNVVNGVYVIYKQFFSGVNKTFYDKDYL